jgi:hypothetical protein
LTSEILMIHLYLLTRCEVTKQSYHLIGRTTLKVHKIRSLHVVTVGEMGDSVLIGLPKLCSTTMRMPQKRLPQGDNVSD